MRKSVMCSRQFRIQLAFGTFYNFAMTLGIFQSVKKKGKQCANIKSVSVNKELFSIG